MIRFVIDIYIIILFADAVLSFLPQFNEVVFVKYIRFFADFSLKPVRKLLKKHIKNELPIDPAPLIVILALYIFMAIW
ncbi:MAG: hypothetical protein ACI9QD_000209 [Thermoproteota archaeon]|jgi:uncharacterized protein YggT (Ycf19 family)